MPVRKGTKQVVVGLIFRHAGLTRAEIAETAELSRPTVSAAVKELIADGVLTEQPGEAGPGRTPARVVLAPPPAVVAAIELSEDYEAIPFAVAPGWVLGKRQVTRGPQALPGAVARVRRQLARHRLPAERLRAVVLAGPAGTRRPRERALREQLGVAPAVAVEDGARLAAL